MSKPLGESHSNRKIVKVAAWMATTPTSIQEAVSNGSRNAVGEMIPVLFATIIAIPVSMKGTLKSTYVTEKLCQIMTSKGFHLVKVGYVLHN